MIRGSETEGVVPGAHGVPGDIGGVEAVLGGDVGVTWWSQVVTHTTTVLIWRWRVDIVVGAGGGGDIFHFLI